MTRDELLTLLKGWAAERFGGPASHDCETEHGESDDALLAYIDDPEITTAYHEIDKWYA